VAEDKLAELGLTPMATLVGWAAAGCEPSHMGIGPVPAVQKLLAAEPDDRRHDLVELNEAFACQVLAVLKGWGWQDQDAIATSSTSTAPASRHPIGATGVRILATLLHELQRRKGRYGLETMCIGGGQGIAAVFERCDACQRVNPGGFGKSRFHGAACGPPSPFIPYLWETHHAILPPPRHRRIGPGALALASTPAAARDSQPCASSSAMPRAAVDQGRAPVCAPLSKELGQPVIVENKTGANATLAGSEVVRAKPDGKTLWFAASPTITISPNVMKQMQFDPAKDLSALAPVLSYYNVLVINNNEPYKNTAELVSYAKAHPQAGYGSAGMGGSNHLGALLFAKRSGIEMNHPLRATPRP
jgi:hypothetical protein